MEYRKFGNTGLEVSALGFGCMRLPVVGGESEKIDEPLATAMLRNAIDRGLNYVDTAWTYHSEQSEPFVGRVLQDGYREKVYLATKMPSWLVKSHEDLERLFNTQLERLQTDHIDFYLLHALNAGYWDNYLKVNVFDWAEKKLADGQIRHLGFSFHDRYEVFDKILNGYANWSFCQLQYNYMDVNEQAGQRGVLEAAEKGLGVIVMEPLRGGKLAVQDPPAQVAKAFSHSQRNWTMAEWALQWLWDQQEVSLLLSGMSTMEQVEQNLQSASRSGVGSLSENDRETISRVQQAWSGLAPVPCTSCEYCMPCPNGVQIPRIFKLYNESVMYDRQGRGQNAYQNDFTDDQRADMCIECGQCESLCPQSIQIIQQLKNAHAYLTGETA
jgi:predicted aldo/keto reductase-like oxidoreductase